MPPENVRYHSSRRALDYIKNTLPKCYDPPPKRTEAIGASTNKSGFRRFYLSKKKGLHRGWWKNNMRDGLGKLIDKNKVEIYEGEFRNDVPNGYGVKSIIRPNGIIDLRYEGEFANGAPNGKGNLHTDTYHYIGQINKGKASGVGIAWYIDGSIYFGTWFGGKRMGQGMIVNIDAERLAYLLLPMGKRSFG
ncbi:unnamed protein product [Nezara viridula]|uniref:Uncharacterized protein n=1 Tax=Nezara viridula TaxID=85310 RepID=A0A9P0MG41_NEZVI|nr:unnamed protein product [Nezara viridula]